jgi:hypothetical protein
MPTTIYFSGAISGGRQDVAKYRQIVDRLRAEGYEVLAEAVLDESIGAGGEALGRQEIFERDMGWLGRADVLVAEISAPSTGVGYEIAAARYLEGIPVICLWRPAWSSRATAMVSGDLEIELIEYREEDFEAMLNQLIEALARIRE